MTDEQRHLRDDSDKLLTALEDMKRMEEEKREQQISSDHFHQLADDIEDQSREVFRIADDQRRAGDASPRTGDSIDTIASREEATAAD